MDTDRSSAATSALLVIDLQRGLFERPTPVYEAEALLRAISTLIAEAHDAGSPVVFIRHSNKMLVPDTEPWRLHPSIEPAEQDLIVDKVHGDAFRDTALDAQLKARCVDTVYVTGLVSEGCVRATCLGARERGYRVILVSDAHSSFHRAAAERVREWNERLASQLDAVCRAGDVAFDGRGPATSRR